MRAQEPGHGSDMARRRGAVQERSRPAGASLSLQAARAGALRCRHGTGAHDHTAGQGRDALSALQPRQRPRRRDVWGGESRALVRLPDGLLLGGCAGTGQLPGHRGPLHVRRGAREDDLSALPPARRRAKAGGSRPSRRLRPQLPGPALGGERQDQQHLVAVPPAGQPSRRRRPQGVRLRDRGHRPARAGQPASGRHLPDRARAGRRQAYRQGQQAAGGGTGGRHPDRRHDLAEVSLRPGRAAAGRGSRFHRCRHGLGAGTRRRMGGRDRRTPVRRRRGRSPLQSEWRDGPAAQGRPGGGSGHRCG